MHHRWLVPLTLQIHTLELSPPSNPIHIYIYICPIPAQCITLGMKPSTWHWTPHSFETGKPAMRTEADKSTKRLKLEFHLQQQLMEGSYEGSLTQGLGIDNAWTCCRRRSILIEKRFHLVRVGPDRVPFDLSLEKLQRGKLSFAIRVLIMLVHSYIQY